MRFDEALEKADKIKGPIDDPCSLGTHNRTSDAGQRQFRRRKLDVPMVTVFKPVPGRPGEFTSMCTRSRFGSDGRLGAMEDC